MTYGYIFKHEEEDSLVVGYHVIDHQRNRKKSGEGNKQ